MASENVVMPHMGMSASPEEDDMPERYSQAFTLVEETLDEQSKAGFVRLLRGSPALRARGISKPEKWSLKRKFAIEKLIHGYLHAREVNHEGGDSTIGVLELYEAAANECRIFTIDMLKVTIPEFLGVYFDDYYADYEVLPYPDMYELSRERIKDYKTVRNVVADMYETAEGFVMSNLKNAFGRSTIDTLDVVFDTVYRQMSFDMRPKTKQEEVEGEDGKVESVTVPAETYELHIVRLVASALMRMEELTERMFDHLIDELYRQIESGDETELWRISREAVRTYSNGLARIVFFLTMHLMDDKARGGFYHADGRFGRLNLWEKTTGVRHGQWPVTYKRARMPSPVAIQTRSRTPSPTVVNTRKPPKTQRLQTTRNARADVSRVSSVRRQLSLMDVDDDEDVPSGSGRQ